MNWILGSIYLEQFKKTLNWFFEVHSWQKTHKFFREKIRPTPHNHYIQLLMTRKNVNVVCWSKNITLVESTSQWLDRHPHTFWMYCCVCMCVFVLFVILLWVCVYVCGVCVIEGCACKRERMCVSSFEFDRERERERERECVCVCLFVCVCVCVCVFLLITPESLLPFFLFHKRMRLEK